MIKWALNGDPDCRYDNWLGETPVGRILITWKGWKDDDPVATLDAFPWDGRGDTFFPVGTPDELKAACEAELMRRVRLMVAPEVDALRAEVERLRAEVEAQHQALITVAVERDDARAACDEWLSKSEWVRGTATPGELGMHLADVLRQRIERLQDDVEAQHQAMIAIAVERDDARTEAERLRADAERYRWIADKQPDIDWISDPDNQIVVWAVSGHGYRGRTLTAAIDAARAAQEGKT